VVVVDVEIEIGVEVVVVVDDDVVDAVTFDVSLLRALTLFPEDTSVSGANVGKSILTCELLSDASEDGVGNGTDTDGEPAATSLLLPLPLLLLLLPLLLLLLLSSSSSSPKPSSSKSASKLLDGVVLPPAAPPAPPRFPARMLFSSPGPATRITCAIMRLTIESIS